MQDMKGMTEANNKDAGNNEKDNGGRADLLKGKNGERQAYTYMVECSDGSLYTGWTYDLNKRMESHNSGKGAKYTRSRLPVKLVYYEIVKNKVVATRREYAIKHLTRKDKLNLVESTDNPVRGSMKTE